jgi:predicted Zn-dependent peptidase
MRTLIVLALFAAVSLAVALPVRGAEELVLPQVTRTTLANGLRIVVAEYHELPLVDVAVFVGAGAAQDPPGKEGLAELTSNALRRGTSALSADALAEKIESLGGLVNAQAGTDATIVTSEFLSGDVAAGIDLLRGVLRDPAFARDEVRRARDEQLAGIVAALEEPAAIAEVLRTLVYGKHPYSLPVDGRRDSVEDLGERRPRLYDRWYRPNDTILVIVGDVQDDAIRRVRRSATGNWGPTPSPRSGAPEPYGRRVLLVDKPDATQTQIRIGNIAMARRDPDLLPSQVANTILGGGFTSRLIEELRVKRSLTYGAASAFVARRVGGDFRIQTFTKTPTTVETVKLALEVYGDFRSHPLDPKQVDKAKTYLRGQFPIRLEPPEAIAMRLAEIEFNDLPPDELETYRGRVAAVTPALASEMARKHMPAPDTVAITVVGKASEIRAPLEAAFGPVTVVSPSDCDALMRKSSGAVAVACARAGVGAPVPLRLRRRSTARLPTARSDASEALHRRPDSPRPRVNRGRGACTFGRRRPSGEAHCCVHVFGCPSRRR